MMRELHLFAGAGGGILGGMHRLKALGNGQVPQCAAEAWRILMGASPGAALQAAGVLA